MNFTIDDPPILVILFRCIASNMSSLFRTDIGNDNIASSIYLSSSTEMDDDEYDGDDDSIAIDDSCNNQHSSCEPVLGYDGDLELLQIILHARNIFFFKIS